MTPGRWAHLIRFEWDSAKAARNARKHGVSFARAATAFGDPFSLVIDDERHSQSEPRYVLLGMTEDGELVVVVHTERGENLRIISARRATRSERSVYEEA